MQNPNLNEAQQVEHKEIGLKLVNELLAETDREEIDSYLSKHKYIFTNIEALDKLLKGTPKRLAAACWGTFSF